MEKLKYKVIKNKTQYKEYCRTLEKLVLAHSKTKEVKDEIELLTILIEKWDHEHNSFEDLNPIELLHTLMEQQHLKPKELVGILSLSKGLVSEILHYKKGLSKEVIRNLSEYFKISQEAFNHPYKLKSPVNSYLRNASVMNTEKELALTQ